MKMMITTATIPVTIRFPTRSFRKITPPGKSIKRKLLARPPVKDYPLPHMVIGRIAARKCPGFWEEITMSANDGKFPCSACQRRYTWKPELAGKRVKCKCGEVMRVPQRSPAEEAADADALPPDMADLADLAVSTGTPADDAMTPPPIAPARPATAAKGAKSAALVSVAKKAIIGGDHDDDEDSYKNKWWYYLV